MRITHAMISQNVNYNLQQNLSRLERTSDQLSTGEKFNRASQEPVGTSKTMRFSNSIDRNDQYQRNINEARGWLNATESALYEGTEVLQRIQELTVYGANEDLTSSDRESIAEEIDELYHHLVGVGNTEYNGLYIFGGHQTGDKPYQEQQIYNLKGEGLEIPYQTVHEDEENTDNNLQMGALQPGVEVEFVEGEEGDELEVETQENENGTTVTITLEEDSNTYEEIASAISDDQDAASLVKVQVEGDPETELNFEDLENDNGTFELTAPLLNEDALDASGLQTGDYQINLKDAEDLEDEEREPQAEIIQERLQGATDSIFGKGELVIDENEIEDRSGSLQLEVTDHDPGTGEVTYSYNLHQYQKDGTHEEKSGEFTLTLGEDNGPQALGEEDEDLDFLQVSGLEEMSAAEARNLEPGDQAIINFTPEKDGDNGDQVLEIKSEIRDDSATQQIVLEEGFFPDNEDPEEQELDLNFYTMETFDRSPRQGEVYDGNISLNFQGSLEEMNNNDENDHLLSFSYDEEGFVVYQGDQGDRLQEISPYQEVSMNADGHQAFGEDKVFAAVKDVYRALKDNDRRALGDEALGNVQEAKDLLLNRQADVGARMNRVERMDENLADENLFLEEVRSEVHDVDIAEAVSEYAMQEQVYQASLSTAARMLEPTLVDYLR